MEQYLENPDDHHAAGADAESEDEEMDPRMGPKTQPTWLFDRTALMWTYTGIHPDLGYKLGLAKMDQSYTLDVMLQMHYDDFYGSATTRSERRRVMAYLRNDVVYGILSRAWHGWWPERFDLSACPATIGGIASDVNVFLFDPIAKLQAIDFIDVRMRRVARYVPIATNGGYALRLLPLETAATMPPGPTSTSKQALRWRRRWST